MVAQSQLVAAAQQKMGEFGIPFSELGFVPQANATSVLTNKDQQY